MTDQPNNPPVEQVRCRQRMQGWVRDVCGLPENDPIHSKLGRVFAYHPFTPPSPDRPIGRPVIAVVAAPTGVPPAAGNLVPGAQFAYDVTAPPVEGRSVQQGEEETCIHGYFRSRWYCYTVTHERRRFAPGPSDVRELADALHDLEGQLPCSESGRESGACWNCSTPEGADDE
jgi:hypothetical protein